MLKTIADNSTFALKVMKGSDFRFPKLYTRIFYKDYVITFSLKKKNKIIRPHSLP